MKSLYNVFLSGRRPFADKGQGPPIFITGLNEKSLLLKAFDSISCIGDYYYAFIPPLLIQKRRFLV